MRIFVINLPSRVDRRAFMQKQFDELGLEVEFIEAYDGRAQGMPLKSIFDPVLAQQANGTALSAGQLGCAVSHRSVYERIENDSIPRALILEDDVRLCSAVVDLIKNERLLSSKPWSWLQIDYPPVGMAFLLSWLQNTATEIRKKPLFILYALIKFPYILLLSVYEAVRDLIHSVENPSIAYFARPLYLTSAYIVTLEAAKTLLSLSTPIKFPSDRLPNQARMQKNFLMRAVVPLLTTQERSQFSSDIA